MSAIEISPSFPRRLESEAACAPVKAMPSWQKTVAFLALAGLIVLSLLVLDAVFGRTDSSARIAAVALGAISYLGFSVVHGQFLAAHVRKLQTVARDKGAPSLFRFSEGGFEIHLSNARSHYDWSAIDDVIALGAGTGLRVGVWVFPVSDADLPAGLSGDAFRARVAEWRAS